MLARRLCLGGLRLKLVAPPAELLEVLCQSASSTLRRAPLFLRLLHLLLQWTLKELGEQRGLLRRRWKSCAASHLVTSLAFLLMLLPLKGQKY